MQIIMVTTTKDLIDQVHHIGDYIDRLISRINTQNKIIVQLKDQNLKLKTNNQNTLKQIQEYINELEQIRNHYVNNHNRPKK